MDLGNIISVTATLQNPAINRYAFGEPAVYGNVDNANIPVGTNTWRFATATALTDLLVAAVDGGPEFTVSHPVYQAAEIVCSQSPRPQTFKVLCGRSNVTQIGTFTVPVVAAPDTIDVTFRCENPAVAGTIIEETVSINGTGVANNDAANLLIALNATAVGLAGSPITFANPGAPSATITFTSTAANDVFWVDDIHNMTYVDSTADRGIAAELNAILAADADWYELIPADAFGAAELQLISVWANGATLKYCSIQTQDDVVFAGTGIFDTLTGLNHTKTTGIATRHGMDEYRNAASSARFLPLDPGTYQRAFKSLTGCTPDTFTTAELTAIFADFGNVYTGVEIGGVTIVQGDLQRGYCFGTTESYADTYRLIDATVVEIQQRVFSALRAADKIPMTDPGLSVIRGAIKEAVKSFGPLAYDIETIVVNVPYAADITAADRAARTVRGITASARLAGAINRANISLTLSF